MNPVIRILTKPAFTNIDPSQNIKKEKIGMKNQMHCINLGGAKKIDTLCHIVIFAVKVMRQCRNGATTNSEIT